MALPESVLSQPASDKYAVSVIGGDAVFLVDVCIGQKLHLSPDARMSRPEFRRYVSSLDHDIKTLTIGEFFEKHGLSG